MACVRGKSTVAYISASIIMMCPPEATEEPVTHSDHR